MMDVTQKEDSRQLNIIFQDLETPWDLPIIFLT